MVRPLVAGLLASLLLLAGVARTVAEDPDPEPPKPRSPSMAKSGDYTVTIDKTGIVNASNKLGQLLWKARLARRGVPKEGQIAIDGDYVVVAQSGITCALDLRSGKTFWRRINGLGDAALKVKDGKATLTVKGKKEVIDIRTGRVLETSR
jgi:hypothetical protein